MSINDINNAAAAMNDLKQRYEGFLDDADAQIAARQAAYNTLAANLKNVVNEQMYFIANVDPDAVNPTKVDGGTFNTIAEAVNASPVGCLCEIRLADGKTHAIALNIYIRERRVHLTQSGTGEKPIVEVIAHASGGNNHFYAFVPSNNGSLSFFSCHIKLPTAKPDPALAWSVGRAMVTYSPAGHFCLNIDRCKVSGGMSNEVLGLMMLNVANSGIFNVYSTEFDGPFYGVIGNGIHLISRSALLLSNGATLRQSGVIGTNVLEY
jgi:hypothetical protein